MGTSSKQKGKAVRDRDGRGAKPRPKGRRPTKAQRVQIERRARQRRAVAGVLVVALVAGVAIAVLASRDGTSSGTPSASGSVSVDRAAGLGPLVEGDPMPSFRAPGVDGGPVAWSPGSPAVVAVWAPWCPHCQEELPVVAEVAAEFPDLELFSVATAIGDQPSRYTPATYMHERGLSFPVALDDASDTIGSGLGITGFPTLFVVDADGIVRATASGETPPDDLREMFAEVA